MGDVKSNDALRDAIKEYNEEEAKAYTQRRLKKIERGQKVGKKEEKEDLILPTDVELFSTIRRLVWNMDYWMNGSKLIVGNHYNPLEIDNQTNLSKFGWKRDKITGKMLLADVTLLGNLTLKMEALKKLL
jgi:hypothetical protein